MTNIKWIMERDNNNGRITMRTTCHSLMVILVWDEENGGCYYVCPIAWDNAFIGESCLYSSFDFYEDELPDVIEEMEEIIRKTASYGDNVNITIYWGGDHRRVITASKDANVAKFSMGDRGRDKTVKIFNTVTGDNVHVFRAFVNNKEIPCVISQPVQKLHY